MDKLPPHDLQIEQAIIGNLLMYPENAQETLQRLKPDMMYDYRAKEALRGVQACISKGYDYTNELTLKREIEREGGEHDFSYMADAIKRAVFDTEDYIEIALEHYFKREVIKKATAVIRDGYESESDIKNMLSKLKDIVSSIDEGTATSRMLTASEIIERDKDKPKNEKIYTGIRQIDEGILKNSLCRGHNILVMAESGHGKTQMSLFLAELLLRQGYKVAWFQLEGYDSHTAQHFYKVTPDLLHNILISDKIHDVDDIVSQARIAKREHGIDFIVVDYMQNVEMQGKESKIEKTERISRTLTKLSIELNTVLNVCSQITIDTSARKGWNLEPRENDGRWSRQMKQDADAIITVFRPSSIDGLYDIVNGQSIAKDWNGNDIPYNSVFARIVKDRHGERDNKRLHMIHTEHKGLKMYDKVWHNTITETKAPF